MPSLPSVGSHTGREITESLVTALEAVEEALDHYKSTESLVAFDEAVRRGVSRELTNALSTLATHTDEAEVQIDWASSGSIEYPPSELTRTFEFSRTHAPILDRASTHLASMAPTAYVRVSGWVRLLARPERGQPGLISLRVLAGSDARTLKVRLTNEQFEIAARAMTEEQGLTVSGRQEQDGRTHWLYEASDVRVTELPPPVNKLVSHRIMHSSQDQLPEGPETA